MEIEDAEKISVLLMQINASLNQSVRFVMDKDSEDNFKSYRLATGKIIGDLYVDLLRPLWDRFPELLPEQMEGSYIVNKEIYEPYFYMPDENP